MPAKLTAYKAEISAFQAGMVVATITAISNHALSLTYLVRAGGRDAWMAGFVILPPMLLVIAAVVSLSNAFPGRSLVQYLPKVLGPGLGHVLAGAYIIYFLLSAIFGLRRTTDWMIDSVLTETPAVVIAALYLAACLYVALGGIEILARVNQLTLPTLTIVGMFVSVMTMPAKNYQLLLPMFEYGLGPVFTSSVVALCIFGEISVLAMFTQYVKDRQRLFKAGAWGVVYAAWVMIGPTAGAIASLGYRQAANMPYPTYQQWLLVSFARFIERTDLLTVHQWLVGAYVRTGLLIWAAAQGTSQLLGIKRWRLFLIGGGVLVLASSLVPFPDVTRFDVFVTRYYLPVSGFMGVLLPLLIWVVAAVRGQLSKGGSRRAKAG